jgi:hypothetical protein
VDDQSTANITAVVQVNGAKAVSRLSKTTAHDTPFEQALAARKRKRRSAKTGRADWNIVIHPASHRIS